MTKLNRHTCDCIVIGGGARGHDVRCLRFTGRCICHFNRTYGTAGFKNTPDRQRKM